VNFNGPRSGLARVGAAAWSIVGIALVVLLAGWAVGRLMPVVLPLAVAVLLARFAISQMDVPARQAYTMAVVARAGGPRQPESQGSRGPRAPR
jgi:hypothetical protein